MQWYESVWSGLIQGITEFIPVSSSGHLEIVQQLLGGRNVHFHYFIEFINLGTLLALLIFYRKRIAKILHEIFVKRDFKFAINIIITCIPVVVVGLLLSDFIEKSPFFSYITVVASAMAIVGVLMILIEKLPKMKPVKNERKLSKKQALYIGLAQCLALIPGVSRSGSTIVAGRVVGLDNKSAADYSFTVSIVVMLGVMCKTLISGSSRAYICDNWQMLLLSNAVAFVAGMIALKFVMNYLGKKNSLQNFGWYRVILATVVVIFNLLM